MYKFIFVTGFLIGSFLICEAEEPDSIVTQQLDEVVVTGNSPFQRIDNVQLGAAKLELKVMEKAPVLFGEVDIIKSITLLPGVRQANGRQIIPRRMIFVPDGPMMYGSTIRAT